MAFLLVLFVGGAALISGLLWARARNAARWGSDLVAYSLRFPQGLDAKAVTTFIAGLSALFVPRARRSTAVRAVMFETTATRDGISHHLLVHRSDAHLVLAGLRAALPNVIARPDEGYQLLAPTAAAELGLSNHQRPLGLDNPAATCAHLLASLQPLGPGEHIVVQWSARPVGPRTVVPPAANRPASQGLADQLRDALAGRTYHDAETVKALRAKQSSPLFICSGRVGAIAQTRVQAEQLLTRALAAFHPVSSPGVHLFRRRLTSSMVARALHERRVPVITYPATLSASELGALVGFPIGQLMLPGLRLGGCRQLAPSVDIPSQGRVVAKSSFPGAERPLALSVSDSLRHLHLIAPTGAGKSTVIVNLATQDMAAGRGIIVVDPKGDLVADVLDRVPADRIGDVVVLDPTDEERPVGLNLLSGASEAPELIVDQIVTIFHQLYASSWGPRTADILRSALLTLAGEPGATLIDVPLLLTDPSFRRRLVGRLDDPIALGPFWGWYESLSEPGRAAAIGPVQNKLRALLLSKRLRNVLGQAEPKLILDQVLSQRRILLVPLGAGLLGEESAALIGTLFISQLWRAVQRRAAMPAADRAPVFGYADEFQTYLRLPLSFAEVLAQARGLGFGLTLAHQHLGQLPTEVREAVLANARSRIAFQMSATDAAAIARELAPHLTAADLGGLGRYEVVASLSAGGRVAPPVTGITLAPLPPTGQAAAARRASRARYGIDRAEIEAALRARYEGGPGNGAGGRLEVAP